MIPEHARPKWHRWALCRGRAPLFFPERGEPTNEAKALCAACPVRAQCLDFAMEHPGVFGIWGGTSVRQRQQLRRERPAS